MLALLPHGASPLMRTELYQLLLSQIAAGYVGRVYNDPDYPDFAPMYNLILNQGFPNPDDTIYLTPIRDNGIYKISGVRGSVRHVTFQIGSGTAIPYGAGALGPSLADYNIDTLRIAASDKSFEVVLSADRPVGHNGDWWKLDAGATYIVVRQRAYDWLNEVDGRFAIERLDIPAAKPRPGKAELHDELSRISQWAETFGRMCLDGPFVRHLRADGLINKVTTRDYAASSGHASQLYTEGLFDLEDDEALVIESTIPERCTYWGFQLADDLWRSMDWVNRQSSLNGFTAKLDSDGKLRVIVAKQDPGVSNWLDTCDRNTGMVYGRWTECSAAPKTNSFKVKCRDLRMHLPNDTLPVSLDSREQTIRLRRKGAQMRRRW
jgi:hypothetical protein